jgi:hypothetical protein
VTANAVHLGLHPLQADVYRSLKRFRVVVAGRRWGKTRLAAAELILRGLKGKPGRYWYIGPDRTAAKDILWSQLKAMVDPSWLAKAPMETELAIDLVTGAQLALKGAEEPDRLRGRGLRFVVLDEYADMKPETWEAVIRPQLADYRAPALFIGTPKSFNHLYHLFLLGQQDDAEWHSWQFRSIDNPLLDPEEIEDARRSTDPRTFRQEWEASFEAMAGRAYYAFSRQHHVQPVTLDPTLPVCVSTDFNINPCCAVIAQVEGQSVRVWREAKTRHAGGEATRATARRCKELLAEAGFRGEVRLYGDPAGSSGKTTGPSDHAVLREIFAGATWCIPRAHPHVRDRVAAVNGRCETMLGDRYLAVDPSCVGLIADLEQVIFAANGDIDKTSNPELTHLSDALGYLVAREFPAVSRQAVAAIHSGVERERPSSALSAMRARKSAERAATLQPHNGNGHGNGHPPTESWAAIRARLEAS